MAGCFWLTCGDTLNSSVGWASGSNIASHIECEPGHISSPPCASHLVGWASLLMAVSGEHPTAKLGAAKLGAIKFLATEVQERPCNHPAILLVMASHEVNPDLGVGGRGGIGYLLMERVEKNL